MSAQNYSEIRLSRISANPIINGIGEASDVGEQAWPRYIRITDIRGLDQLNPEDKMSLKPALAAKAEVERDDILMAAVGATVGDAYIHQSDDPACFAGYLVRFRANKALAHPRFVAYWTQSSHYRHQIRSGYVGSTIENFSASKYRAMRIPLPGLSVQREVSQFLDRETAKIDALIDKQEQLIATLREDRAATITQAVTKGLDPDVEMKDSGVLWLGPTPASWTPKRLKHMIKSVQSGTSVNAVDAPALPNEFGVLKTSCVSSGWFNPDANKTVLEEEQDRLTCPVTPDTLVVNRANTPDLVGASGYVREPRPNLFLSDKLWQVTFTDALAEYVHYWTHTPVYRTQISANSVGTSSSMQNLSMFDFQNLSIALPSISEQRSIVDFLSTRIPRIDALIEKSTEMTRALREYRSALITNAVTGKIDVREAV